MLPHLSTSTPASEVSSADFARMEGNDRVGNSDETALPDFGDILKNSPAAKLIGLKTDDDESLPKEEGEVAPEKSDEEVDVPSETSDDAVNDSDEEGSKESEEGKTDEDDQESTQQADLPAEEDIDWEYKIPVKIDGKVEYKTLEEVRKGFATDQHLSQKGREIGEARKQLEAEGKKRLDEIVQIGTVLHEELTRNEAALAQEYNKLEAEIKAAKDSGDTYTARELKEKRDEIKEQYWAVRNKREAGAKAVVAQIQKRQAEEQQRMLEHFQAEIPKLIPNFDEKTAKSIREFALKEGISGELLEQIYDPVVVKFINDYRLLKTAKETGAAKRKNAPVVKSVPSKKGPSQAAVTKRETATLRSKVLSGQGSKSDETAFLASISSIRHKL